MTMHIYIYIYMYVFRGMLNIIPDAIMNFLSHLNSEEKGDEVFNNLQRISKLKNLRRLTLIGKILIK